VSQSRIQFLSNGRNLEGIISVPKDAKKSLPGVVLCPPHPYLNGGMDVRIFNVLSSVLEDAGLLVLRFNYRGIGDSRGEFTNGKDEFIDIKSALETLAHWPDVNKKRIGLVAYSFGASVVLRSFKKLKNLKAIVLVSPPPSSLVVQTQLPNQTSVLILAGDKDRIAPAQRISQVIVNQQTEFKLQVVNDADHSWIGKEEQAAKYISQFLAEALSN